jgi:hypothetical protein
MPPPTFKPQFNIQELFNLARQLYGQPQGQPATSPVQTTQTPVARPQVDPTAGPQAAPQMDFMALINAIAGSQENITRMQLDAIKPRGVVRRDISGALETDIQDGKVQVGLDKYYQKNQHLHPINFESPTDPARFNNAVWNNKAGPTIAPPSGSKVVGGQIVPMDGSEIFDSLAQANSQATWNALPQYGTATAVQPNKPVQGQGTTNVNGVQTPLAAFLQGAGNLPPSLPSSSYQLGLSPEELRKLAMNPSFGKVGSPGTMAPRRVRGTSVTPRY